jgi:hypothetical protein
MWSEREKDLVARCSHLEFRLTQWEAKCKTREAETMQEGKDSRKLRCVARNGLMRKLGGKQQSHSMRTGLRSQEQTGLSNQEPAIGCQGL